MENEFESLTSGISQIKEMVREALHTAHNSDSSNDTESVSDKYSRLGQLILRLQDGDLEKRYVLRFEKWLLTDRDALEYYVDFTNICAGLHCMLSKKSEQSLLNC